jgi:hypothetical protein
MAEIDVGSAATNRGYAAGADYTCIVATNPANDTGSLDTVEVYCELNKLPAEMIVGTMHGSGTSYTPRDYVNVGEPSVGANIFTGLSIDCETNDLIAWYSYNASSGPTVSYDKTGGSGYYYKSGNQFAAGTQTYTFDSGNPSAIFSLYGTGETVVAGGGTLPLMSKKSFQRGL